MVAGSSLPCLTTHDRSGVLENGQAVPQSGDNPEEYNTQNKWVPRSCPLLCRFGPVMFCTQTSHCYVSGGWPELSSSFQSESQKRLSKEKCYSNPHPCRAFHKSSGSTCGFQSSCCQCPQLLNVLLCSLKKFLRKKNLNTNF